MIVLDASAVLELLLATTAGDTVRRRIAPAHESLHAPHLLDIEVAQALRRYHRSGEVSRERGQQALDDLRDLGLRRYEHGLFLARIWALRNHLSAYDAAYVALAEALGAPLLTADRRLANAPGHRAVVEVV